MSDEAPKNKKAIIYTDGGFIKEESVGGWGVHGYYYTEEPPKKGTGNPKCIPTAAGYVAEKAGAKLVEITHYLDGVGTVFGARSSNHTELTATSQALNWIVNNGLTHSTIHSDSQYVVDGINKGLNAWKNNGWKNRQGETIANLELWQKTSDLLDQIKSAENNVIVKWLRGHNGDFGNTKVDDWARKGNALGKRKIEYSFMKETDAAGYWKADKDTNRLLDAGRWYFSTTDLNYKTEDGKYIYYLGSYGKEDELTGKRMTETCMQVVILNEPDPVFEMLREEAMVSDRVQLGAIMIGRLDNILNSGIYSELLEHGVKFLDIRPKRKDLIHSRKKPILVELSPAGLAYNAVDNLNALQRRLEAFRKNDVSLITTDITDLIYETEIKKDKPIRKISNSITQSTKYLDFPVRYSTKMVSQLTGHDDPDIETTTLRLIVGRDLPRRSTLAAAAEQGGKVTVVTWRESDYGFRFATVLESEIGLGIWAGVDSNILFVKK